MLSTLVISFLVLTRLTVSLTPIPFDPSVSTDQIGA